MDVATNRVMEDVFEATRNLHNVLRMVKKNKIATNKKAMEYAEKARKAQRDIANLIQDAHDQDQTMLLLQANEQVMAALRAYEEAGGIALASLSPNRTRPPPMSTTRIYEDSLARPSSIFQRMRSPSSSSPQTVLVRPSLHRLSESQSSTHTHEDAPGRYSPPNLRHMTPSSSSTQQVSPRPLSHRLSFSQALNRTVETGPARPPPNLQHTTLSSSSSQQAYPRPPSHRTTSSQAPIKTSPTSTHPFNLERDRPELLRVIAETSQAAINLLNALKLVNRDRDSLQANRTVQARWDQANAARKKIVHLIQVVEDEELIGTLLETNERLTDAFQMYEALSDPAAEVFYDEQEGQSLAFIPNPSPRPSFGNRHSSSSSISHNNRQNSSPPTVNHTRQHSSTSSVNSNLRRDNNLSPSWEPFRRSEPPTASVVSLPSTRTSRASSSSIVPIPVPLSRHDEQEEVAPPPYSAVAFGTEFDEVLDGQVALDPPSHQHLQTRHFTDNTLHNSRHLISTDDDYDDPFADPV